jgi:phosphoribosyl 1,2-cyclic phosphate phosphodiesterase
MKITFLGTGTSTGVPYIGCGCEVCKSEDSRDNRLRCSSLIETDGKKILIDCGPDFRQQALNTGLCHIDGVLLTHEHMDHIGGIDDLRPFGNTDIYGEKRTVGALRNMFAYCFNNTYPGIPSLTLHEIVEDEEFTVCGVTILPIRAYHYKLPVLGYKIDKTAYLTDFKTIDEKEKDKLRNLDVLIIDALRKKEHLSHINLYEALALIKEVAPKQAYLIHMSHDMGLHEAIQQELPQNVFMAYDGLTIEC